MSDPSSLPMFRLKRLAAATTLSLSLAGCHHALTDAELTTNVHNAIAADPTIHQQSVQITSQNGVVTLSGNVSDDTASSVAAQDAAKVKGVKEVVNSLQVAGIQVAPTVTSSDAPSQPRQTTAAERQALAQGQPLSAPSSSSAAAAPPPPSAPVVRSVTAPEGTTIPIRITERLDSQTSTDGEPFNGVITHEVVHDGLVIIPAGSAVSGRVITAKDAAHFKGHALLSIQLTAVRRHGTLLPITTDAYTVEGKNRGKNSAEKIGGGAAVGALLGGIFGHGKGALIGAAAGGGAGTAVQGFTRGQQVEIASESLVRFRLARPLAVQTTETPSNYDPTTLHER